LGKFFLKSSFQKFRSC